MLVRWILPSNSKDGALWMMCFKENLRIVVVTDSNMQGYTTSQKGLSLRE